LILADDFGGKMAKRLIPIILMSLFLSFQACSRGAEDSTPEPKPALKPGSGTVAAEKVPERTQLAEKTEEIKQAKELGAAKNGEEEGQKRPKTKSEETLEKVNESVADSFSEHGRGAVVRSGDKLTENEKRHLAYNVNSADSEKPATPLEFKGLRKIYTYFRIKERLPQEVVDALNGSRVMIVGAVMPFESIPENGEVNEFWLANPRIVAEGCVFCNPPTLADLVYIYRNEGEAPFKFDRETLFKKVTLAAVTGRLFFGPDEVKGQLFLNSILASDVEIFE
jgi:hypothetical protein